MRFDGGFRGLLCPCVGLGEVGGVVQRLRALYVSGVGVMVDPILGGSWRCRFFFMHTPTCVVCCLPELPGGGGKLCCFVCFVMGWVVWCVCE